MSDLLLLEIRFLQTYGNTIIQFYSMSRNIIIFVFLSTDTEMEIVFRYMHRSNNNIYMSYI